MGHDFDPDFGTALDAAAAIVGSYLEDATPIGFARVLAQEIGGFQRPKSYEL
jgi:hypothetical protein